MTSRKPDSTYARNRKKPQPFYPLRPEPVDKCVFCGILERNRRGIEVLEYGHQLVCDRCLREAARGARMEADPDERVLPTLKSVRP